MTTGVAETSFAHIAFGLACYAAFLLTSAYAVGFVGNHWTTFGWHGAWFRSLDHGPTAPLGEAIAVDLALVVCSACNTA